MFRRVLSKVTWGLSTGSGTSKIKEKLDGYGISQSPNAPVRIYSIADPSKYYTNWFNNSSPDNNGADPSAVNVNSGKLGFKAKSFSIPLKATVHYEFNRYRIGGGYSMEYMIIDKFKPLSNGDKIHGYSPQVSSLWMKHYFGMVGASVYRYYEYNLVVDLNIGGYKLGGGFNNGLIHRGLYYNLGATIERDMSEYFRLFVRPSYEIKTYSLAMAGATPVKHRFNAFYLNVGATYRIPELRRCYLKDCHAQLNHAHGNREYRSRRHPIYKKQNPRYGENFPVILKYKGRNKNKLNPY